MALIMIQTSYMSTRLFVQSVTLFFYFFGVIIKLRRSLWGDECEISDIEVH
jgi:hypothetical protein